MVNDGVQWWARSKQVGGRFRKLWGRVTRNADCEFRGQLLIIAGKLEAYYASGCAGAPGVRRQSRIGGFIERRRSFHVVA
jgi:hypothetical protein